MNCLDDAKKFGIAVVISQFLQCNDEVPHLTESTSNDVQHPDEESPQELEEPEIDTAVLALDSSESKKEPEEDSFPVIEEEGE